MELCSACNHDIEIHVKNIVGNVICLSVDNGVSSRGVIGIPYSIVCDCKNHYSKRAIIEAESEAYEIEANRNLFK